MLPSLRRKPTRASTAWGDHRNGRGAGSADAALAVVDVDTLWRGADGAEEHWLGRVAKGYTLVGEELKLVFHTGALEYGAG